MGFSVKENGQVISTSELYISCLKVANILGYGKQDILVDFLNYGSEIEGKYENDVIYVKFEEVTEELGGYVSTFNGKKYAMFWPANTEKQQNPSYPLDTVYVNLQEFISTMDKDINIEITWDNYETDRDIRIAFIGTYKEVKGITINLINGINEGFVDSASGTLYLATHAKETYEQIMDLVNLPWDAKCELIKQLAINLYDYIEENIINAEGEKRAEEIGKLIGGTIFDALLTKGISKISFIKDSDQLAKLSKKLPKVSTFVKNNIQVEDILSKIPKELVYVIKGIAQAIETIKTAIKSSLSNLDDKITKIYSRIDDQLDLEYAGIGRINLEESQLIENTDEISQLRWVNYIEERWAETAGDLIDDAEELLIDGQHYTRNGRIKVLKSSITYITNGGHKYKTDNLGRIIDTIAENLELKNGGTNKYAQKVAGRMDRKATDDGGHLIARIFNGSKNLDNLVSMDSNLNRGAWSSMENTWKAALEQGKKVSVNIKISYEGMSKRPSEFEIIYKIDGRELIKQFKNMPGGGL